ncbi:MAG: exodeoxyribonuclease VII small subunit [bacterium]|nr:exodeoxyribonuclease VII small subunit [bacterium]
MPAQKKPKDFETAVARLEEITELLESGDESLEKSIKLYTEGLEIAGFCSEQLNEAEKKIKIIAEKAGVKVETDFESGDEG